MPRGFLVKRRSRRPAGAFRVRPPGGPAAPRLEEAPRVPEEPPEEPPQEPPQPPHPRAAVWGPVDSAAPEPEPPAPPRTPPPPPDALPAAPKRPPPRARALPAAGKKPKAARRLSFADEVTTSPVLGLRIKAAAAAPGGGEGRARAPPLLGAFVCQLCQEPYADPLALAQHRCSRIVRVEYRCPECQKSFSCPANLASHRRWHRPRPPAAAAPARDKENSRAQHHGAPDSARPPSPAAPPGELFLCPYCRKGFRRQAYLRKHLGTHLPPAPAAPPSFPCPLCGAPFPSADVRDRHQRWHAVRDELLLPAGGAEAGEKQLFACRHCAAAFLSAPGLARHASKCHPAESRQLLLLQLPLRPGC